MTTVVTVVILMIFGAALGSFAAAQVWRLRARQLRADKKTQDPDFDAVEYKRLKPLLDSKVHNDRSRCLSCGHVLAWYDLLPIISWVSLGGKCRYCHKPIGRFELLMEVGVALFFAVSYLVWPHQLSSPLEIAQFVCWLIAGVVLAIQVAYDAKWFLLLDTMNITLAGVSLVYATLSVVVGGGEVGQTVVSIVGSVAIMSGIYGALYLVSRGEWIGFGDVKLGIGLGLLLMTWQQAFIGLFAANLIGCLIILPGMMTGKLTRKSRIPFGPFLIAGTVVGVLWGQSIISWYLTLVSGLFS